MLDARLYPAERGGIGGSKTAAHRLVKYYRIQFYF